MGLRTKLAASAAALITLAAAASAQAGTLYSAPGSTAQMPTNSSFSVTFDGASGLADLSFVLDGYASLDGENWYEDDFTLSLNGSEILKGTFNLGGGGNDIVFFAPVGANIANVSGNGTNVTWAGGHVNIAAPITLAAGSNTLTFAYAALNQDHAGWQDMGDESWGVSDVLVSQAGGAVPEPATWAMMLMGFGALGSVLRQQRRRAVATA